MSESAQSQVLVIGLARNSFCVTSLDSGSQFFVVDKSAYPTCLRSSLDGSSVIKQGNEKRQRTNPNGDGLHKCNSFQSLVNRVYNRQAHTQ